MIKWGLIIFNFFCLARIETKLREDIHHFLTSNIIPLYLPQFNFDLSQTQYRNWPVHALQSELILSSNQQ